MAKIPFDIKYRPQIESGEYKVETKDGRPSRIICWDRDGEYPIIYLTRGEDNCEICFSCTNSGNGYINHDKPRDLLLITPEPELTEFEKAVEAIYDSCNVKELAFKKKAAELLELARKELTRQGNIVLTIEEFEKRHMEAQEAGRKGAMKDLPRWVKVNEGDLLDKYSRYLLCSNEGCYYCCGATITRDGYMLLVDNLEKLPKEDEK